MELSKSDLISGRKFITGKWHPVYVVNFFSNDLAHIPVSEWKSDDGSDLGVLGFEFRADNTLTVTNSSTGTVIEGDWKQTDYLEYEWNVTEFDDLPESQFLKNVKKLMVVEGVLAFSIGFLTIALQKEKE